MLLDIGMIVLYGLFAAASVIVAFNLFRSLHRWLNRRHAPRLIPTRRRTYPSGHRPGVRRVKTFPSNITHWEAYCRDCPWRSPLYRARQTAMDAAADHS